MSRLVAIVAMLTIIAAGHWACSDDGAPADNGGGADNQQEDEVDEDAGGVDDLDTGLADVAVADDVVDFDAEEVGDIGGDVDHDSEVGDADTGEVEEPLEPGGFGDWCDASRPCGDEYFCFQGDEESRGICTRHCDSPGQNCLGIPAPNTRPICHYELDDQQLACAFMCLLDHGDHVHNYDCPPELECQTVDWSTNHYCR